MAGHPKGVGEWTRLDAAIYVCPANGGRAMAKKKAEKAIDPKGAAADDYILHRGVAKAEDEVDAKKPKTVSD